MEKVIMPTTFLLLAICFPADAAVVHTTVGVSVQVNSGAITADANYFSMVDVFLLRDD